MALTDTKLRSTKPDSKSRKLSDGGGLYLLIKPSCSKLWQMAYRFDAKQKTPSFGPYPSVTLSEARALRDRAKKLLAGGLNPMEPTTDTGDSASFGQIGREWLRAQ